MMPVMLELEEVSRLVAQAVQMGYMQAVQVYDPPQDLLRKADVVRWLRIACVERRTFSALEKRGLIRPVRRGTGKNSPLYYSKQEIIRALVSANISSLITRDRLRNLNTSTK